jgi:hypothetical protein
MATTRKPVNDEECTELMKNADLNKDNRIDLDGKTHTYSYTSSIFSNGKNIHINVCAYETETGR